MAHLQLVDECCELRRSCRSNKGTPLRGQVRQCRVQLHHLCRRCQACANQHAALNTGESRQQHPGTSS